MTMAKLAEEMTADYMRNLEALGIDTIDYFPKATDNIDEIIRLTKVLIDKGFAYASAGDVYFDVAKDPGYGKLSRRTTESLQGEGGDMAERKRSPGDFALWKSAKPGEPAWDSPWGKGRPGWHIECSAMSARILGETFDIHGGGLDLVFPHHENEIAQSECAHGKPQAKYWLHNGLMQAASEAGKIGGRNTRPTESDAVQAADPTAQAATKISKSTGASAFRDLLERHQAETIRFFLLSTHYRSPIQYSEELLRKIAISLQSFYGFFDRFKRITLRNFYDIKPAETRASGEFDAGKNQLLVDVAASRQKFLEAMDDDFNSGKAVATLFDLMRALNKFVDSAKLELGPPNEEHVQSLIRGTNTLKELANILGLFKVPPPRKIDDSPEQRSKVEFSATGQMTFDASTDIGQLIRLLLDVRASAKKNKDFATADAVRNGMHSIGFVIQDRAGGQSDASIPFASNNPSKPIDKIRKELMRLAIERRDASRANNDASTADLLQKRIIEIQEMDPSIDWTKEGF